MALKRKDFNQILQKILKDKKLLKEFLADPEPVLERLGLPDITKAAAINIHGKVEKLLNEGLSPDEIIKQYYSH